MKRSLLSFVLCLGLLACGDDDADRPKDDDRSHDENGGDGDGDSGEEPAASTLDRPALPRPPSGGLPAELRPPR